MFRTLVFHFHNCQNCSAEPIDPNQLVGQSLLFLLELDLGNYVWWYSLSFQFLEYNFGCNFALNFCVCLCLFWFEFRFQVLALEKYPTDMTWLAGRKESFLIGQFEFAATSNYFVSSFEVPKREAPRLSIKLNHQKSKQAVNIKRIKLKPSIQILFK